MDENHDGEISQTEFIEVELKYFCHPNIQNNIILCFQACMAQKKFSTMLTLKIIDVFISEEQAQHAIGWHKAA